MEENCFGCMFSTDNEITFLLSELKGVNNDKVMKCTHPNSPYYDELVFEGTICRLYEDASEYFKMKDRKESLEELKEKIRRKRGF